MKYRQLYLDKNLGGEGAGMYRSVELADGTTRPLTKEEIVSGIVPKDGRVFRAGDLSSQGNPIVEFEYNGKKISKEKLRGW